MNVWLYLYQMGSTRVLKNNILELLSKLNRILHRYTY